MNISSVVSFNFSDMSLQASVDQLSRTSLFSELSDLSATRVDDDDDDDQERDLERTAPKMVRPSHITT